jgi:ketosteroid isomerase-like protein
MFAQALPVILSLAAMPAQAAPPASGADAAVVAQLKQVQDEVRAAVARHDKAALERIYADEFLFVHTTGGVDTKTEHIARSLTADTVNAPDGPAEPVPVQMHASVYGDVALTTVQVKTNQNRLLWWTYVFVRRDGRWQIARQHGTAVPPEVVKAAVDPGVYAQYVGKYKYDDTGLIVTVSLEDGTLRSQLAGRPPVTLVPQSETTYLAQPGNAAFTFVKNADGAVTHFIVRRPSGEQGRATKIE